MNSDWQTALLNISFDSSHLTHDYDRKNLNLTYAANLIISSRFRKAESFLLANFDRYPKDSLCLLAFLDLRIRNFSRLDRLVPKLFEDYPNDSFVKSLLVSWCLLKGNKSQLGNPPVSFWEGESSCTYLCLAHGDWLISNDSLIECQDLIHNFLNNDFLEKDILLAKLLFAKRQYRQAIDLLLPWIEYDVSNQDYWRLFLSSHFQGQEGKDLQFFLNKGLSKVPLQEELLDLQGWALILGKKPAQARKAFFRQRLMGWNLLDPLVVAHLYNSYELLGETDSLIHIHPDVYADPTKFLDVHSNLLVHLTSLEDQDQSIKESSINLMTAMKSYSGFSRHEPKEFLPFDRSNINKPLKIGWITGDCRYHPVSRFLLGCLNRSSQDFNHQHHLVSTARHNDEIPQYFDEIEGLNLLDFSSLKAHFLTKAIRDLNLDLAVDLSGWTHGNCAVSFLSRIAPVQINYLGYFGSTGIPSMDWWLGDKNLFPKVMKQWHSEKIFRMPRCFIAWDPHPMLPESKATVLEAVNGPIRFGCFNHLRKLSDLTLRTWAKILSSIPQSRLVLKAAGFEDEMTIFLLRRRVHRAGLDLDRIDFLPFAQSVSDHLSQYRFVDIALDPFPNGGCTTTAEALWMGVPVITLKGNSYVSRMSTAVLRGADLNEWVAQNISEYCELAFKQASDLSYLRNNRALWRRQLLSSPLGDSKGLMNELENSFSQMYSLNLN